MKHSRALQSLITSLDQDPFDRVLETLLKLGDKELREKPPLTRKRNLKRLLNGVSKADLCSQGLAMYAGALALELEGIQAKDTLSPWVIHSWYLQKVKIERLSAKRKWEFRQNSRRGGAGTSY